MFVTHLLRRVAAGFSLIELMVVVAIMAILSSLAIPAYQQYSQRAKVTSALRHAQPMQLAVALCWQVEGSLARCNQPGSRGLPDIANPLPTELSQFLVNDNASLTLELTDVETDSGPLQVQLTPLMQQGMLNWQLSCSDYTGGRTVVSGCLSQLTR